MQLTKAIIHKYNRLHLNPQLKHFSISLSKAVLVVAGDNGSGKSSLCSLLFPWPVEKSSLYTDGAITRHWIHNGHTYIDSIEDDHYSFHVDGGDNLNASGGVRMQESLFTEHFGVDGVLMRLLTGGTSFSKMSPKSRQYWFSRMDNFVLDKLESVVRDMKDDKKETEILLKYNQAQLAKYVTSVNIDELTESAEVYRNQLNILSEVRFPVHSDNIAEIVDQIKTLRKQATSYQKIYRALPRQVEVENIDVLKLDIATMDTIRADRVNRLMGLQSTEICIDGLPSIETCTAEILKLENQQQPVAEQYDNPTLYTSYLYMSSDILGGLSELEDLTFLPTDSMLKLDQEITDVTNQLSKINHTVLSLTERECQLKLDLEHPVSCPKCTHTFGKSGTFDDLSTVQHELATATKVQTRLTAEHVFLLETQTSARRYQKVYSSVCTRLNAWNDTICQQLMKYHPNISLLRNALQEVVAQLHCAAHNKGLDEQKRRYEEHLAVHQAFKDQQETQQSKERDMLTVEINSLDNKIEVVKTRVKYLASRMKLQDEISRHYARLQELGNMVETALQHKLYAGLDKAVSASILEVRGQLASLDNAIHMHTANIKHHNDIMENVSVQMSTLTVVDAAIKCLDGKRGFIGHIYKMRLKTHVDALNAIISNLWNYDLTVLLPGDSMTFRFPLQVDKVERSDVCEGSKGMQEIIDLAFMLLVREYCQVTHLPLILDEFGSALDGVHLDRAFTYLNAYNTDQLVMVSHLTELMNLYDDSQAEYIVLSDRHLDRASIPSSTNECLTFL